MSDFALRVIGEISEYQRKFAEIPGITEREAAKASLAMLRETAKGQAAAVNEAKKAAAAAAAEWEKSAADAAKAQEREAAAAAKAAADKLKAEQAEAKRVAEETARATARLADLAAQSNPIARLTLELRRTKDELAQLAKTTGDEATATRAAADADREYLAALRKIGEEQASATKGHKEAGEAAEGAGKKIKEFGEKAGRAGQDAGKLAGFLGMVSPQAADAARALADVGDVGEVGADAVGALGLSASVAAPLLGALALAAAPVAGALVVMSREADEAAARTEFLKNHAHDLDSALRDLDDASLGVAVATGKMSEEQGKLASIQDRAARALQDFDAGQEKERATAEQALLTAENRQRWLAKLPGFLQTAADYYGGVSSAEKEARFQLDQLDQKEHDFQTTIDETTKAQTRAEKATYGHEQALKAAAAAFDTYAEAAERAKARTDSINATVQGFLDDAKRATTETLTDSEKVLVATDDRITAIGKEKIAKLLLAKTDEERRAIEIAAQRDVDAVTAEGAKKYKDAKDKETKAADDTAKKKTDAQRKVEDVVAAATGGELDQYRRLELQKERALEDYVKAAKEAGLTERRIAADTAKIQEGYARQAAAMQTRSAADMYGAIGDLAGRSAEAIGKKDKAAAVAAFEIGQGAAAAKAALNTELAISEAVASAPPPLNVPAIVAATTEGVAQEIAIATTPPPNYRDTPGVMEMQRGGVVQLAGGDKFLAARTTEDLRRQLDRMAGARREKPAETRVIAVQAFDHRFTAKTLREHLKLPNPLSTAVRGTRRVGYDP